MPALGSLAREIELLHAIGPGSAPPHVEPLRLRAAQLPSCPDSLSLSHPLSHSLSFSRLRSRHASDLFTERLDPKPCPLPPKKGHERIQIQIALCTCCAAPTKNTGSPNSGKSPLDTLRMHMTPLFCDSGADHELNAQCPRSRETAFRCYLHTTSCCSCRRCWPCHGDLTGSLLGFRRPLIWQPGHVAMHMEFLATEPKRNASIAQY